MKRINDQELTEISGGFSGWAAVAVCAAVTFIAGVIDGIARPKKCNS